ncbi:MAG: hypothetical protein ABI729_07735 [Chitinophagales bacterium]
MKQTLLSLVVLILFASCGSLKSTTYIKPYDEFILGNNKHGSFKANLENISMLPIEIYLAPIDGGTHSPQTVAVNKIVQVKVSPNTALVISNKSGDTVAVSLKVNGDIGLSMGYKN